MIQQEYQTMGMGGNNFDDSQMNGTQNDEQYGMDGGMQ